MPAPLITMKHPRVGWKKADCPLVFVHNRWDHVKGTSIDIGSEEEYFRDQYRAAKWHYNMTAAVDLVQRCVSEEKLDRIVDILLDGKKPPRLVLPHPPFDDEEACGVLKPNQRAPTNAIPFALAGYLSRVLGAEIDEDIQMSARVGRTKLGKWARFLWQPHFVGSVRDDVTYIMVDDVCTLGGTFAALRSYIVRSGGTVGGAQLWHTAMAGISPWPLHNAP